MAKYKRIVTTEAGLSLLAKAYESETTITFTAVKTGNGTYTGTENLSKTTALKSVKQSFGLSGVSRTGTQVKVRSVISNNGVTTGYDITEIGLYAKGTDSAEVLYAIIVAENGLEDYLPPFEETPTNITLEMYIAIAEEQSSVTFAAAVVAGTYVAVGDFQDHVSDATHITAAERTSWNAKAAAADFQNHVSSTVHITAAERTAWNAKVSSGDLQSHASNATHITSDERNSWNAKAPASDLQSHASNSTHITAAERTSWNAKAAASDLQAHTSSTSNPHGVTKSQVGLGNVPNVATNDQTPTFTEASANAALTSGEKLSVAFGKIAKAVSSLISHLASTSNPHSVTKSQVGLSNVPNVATNDQTPTYTAASANAELTSGEKISVAFGKIAKAIKSLISHLSDTVSHITAAERTTWNNKLDKTATATNSEKLNGHGAEYFALAELLNYELYGNDKLSTPIKDCASYTDLFSQIPEKSVFIGSTWYPPSWFPNTVESNYRVFVCKQTNGIIFIEVIRDGGKAWIATYDYGTTWSGWKKITLDTDLSEYLPLAGGVLTGGLGVSGSLVAYATLYANGDVSDDYGGLMLMKKANIANIGDVLIRPYYNGVAFYNNDSEWRGARLDMTKCGIHQSSEILHTGISIPVVSSETAPTDTTALWIDTKNLKIKKYINSAWTALS